MNSPRPQPPFGVPTLTEVVEPIRAPVAAAASPEPEAHAGLDDVEAAEPAPLDSRPEMPGVPAERPVAPAESTAFDESQLIERVLADLQRQVELMLEYRLREVLTPALVRATDALVKEARIELASTLRDVVARAVAQELLRHRGR